MKTNNVSNEVFTETELKEIEQEIVSRILSEIYCMTNFNQTYEVWRNSVQLESNRNEILSTYYKESEWIDHSPFTPWLSYNRMTKKEEKANRVNLLRYVSQDKISRLNDTYNKMTDKVVQNGQVVQNKKKESLGELLDRLEDVILNVSRMGQLLHEIGYVIQANDRTENYHIERNDGKFVSYITEQMYSTFLSTQSIDFLKLKVNKKKFKLYYKPSPVVLSDKELSLLEKSNKRALRDKAKIEKSIKIYNNYTFQKMSKVKTLEQFEEVVSHMRGEIENIDDIGDIVQMSYSDSLTCNTLPMIYRKGNKDIIDEGVLHLMDIMADMNTVYDTVSKESLKKNGMSIARKGDTLIPIYTVSREKERVLEKDETVVRVTLNGKTVEKRSTDFKYTNLKTKVKKKLDAAAEWLKDNERKAI